MNSVQNEKSVIENPALYQIAASLLWQDKGLLFLVVIASSLPQWLSLIADNLSFFQSASIITADRFIQTTALYFISIRWISKLRKSTQTFNTKNFLVFTLYSFAFWGLLIFPGLILSSQEIDGGLRSLFIFSIPPALYILFRYYFYFFPIVLGHNSYKRIIEIAKSITSKSRYLPLKTMLAPLAMISFITALLMAPYPDGRISYLVVLSDITSVVFFIVSSYISLAACFLYLGEREWHESKLDPYRQSRLSTFAFNAPWLLSILLKPNNAMKLLFVSILLWTGNVVRLQSMPPSASIKLIEAQAKEDSATLLIEVEDKDYQFKGFQPIYFALAGENRITVSEKILKAKIKDSEDDVRFGLEKSAEKKTILLTFQTNRKNEALTSLQDLYLWYRNVKLEKITFTAKQNLFADANP